MTPRDFYYKYLKADKSRLIKVAEQAGTTFANFIQIARHDGSCSPKLAERLARASDGEMTVIEILFRDKSDNRVA